MDLLLLITLLALIFIGVPFIIIFLSYRIPKKFEKPKLGKWLSTTFALLYISCIIYFIFEDHFFFKYNARNLLSELKIELKDDFTIINNESGGFQDFYHIFNLKISEKDKIRLINEMKINENFNSIPVDFNTLNRYEGKIIYNYYQEGKLFKIGYFKPNGENYTPTTRTITIDPISNELTFEEICD